MATNPSGLDGTRDGSSALRLYLAPDFDSVRVALVRIATELERHGVAPDRIGGAELVLAEVLNNIVEHAFRDLPPGSAEGRIEIALTAAEERVRCDVRDNGSAMPGGRIPLGRPVNAGLKLSDLPEGGFGWFLIRSLVEDLDYRRDGRENILTFSIPFDPERLDA